MVEPRTSLRKGLSREEAEAEVLRRFGDVAGFRERCEELSRQRVAKEEFRSMLESMGQDTRFAARSLSKHAGFSAVVIITLGLAIGSVTAIFSVVNGVLLQPLPYDDPGTLAIIWENDRASGTIREQASVPDYFDFRDRTRAFSAMGMYAFGPATMSRDDGEPHLVDVATVTHNIEEILGITPQIGRGVEPSEDVPDGELVVVLSDDFWRTAFGADPAVLGRDIRIDDRNHTVVGVLPPALDFPVRGVDMWAPMQQSPTTSPRSSHWVTQIGRVAPGVSVAEANAEMVAIAADLEGEYPGDNVNRGAFVEPIDEVVRGGRRCDPVGPVRRRFERLADRLRPTSPTFCWRAVPGAPKRSPYASRWGRAPVAWYGGF